MTIRIYEAFGTIWDHFIYVKVGARFPRPHRVAAFPDSLLATGQLLLFFTPGRISPTRALIYAGTPAVAVCPWKVDDIATKELMVNFYRNMLEKNLDKTETLRQAKLQLLKNQNYRSPLYWSAFVMYGE